MKNIAVYCGASEGNDQNIVKAAIRLADWLVDNDFNLVYGGGGVGLMGILAKRVLDRGGKVYGIMPQELVDRGAAYDGLTELKVVADMSERKQLMLEMSDGSIALPGGPGTLEEIIEAFSWSRLGDNENPCVLFNVDGYYNQLRDMFDHMTEKGFLTRKDRSKLFFTDKLENVYTFMYSYIPPKIREY
ncbi:TIGR00730 family Rossman fold protein [Companilactobacillus furfuricola]|uniref:LOG family protein n=1 Tax=Companilactobacillus furfuricola TaxID=1462575 RepID=UPI000F76B8E7|nr:TIGR00730 family Rossman fold protein [Companilactobacillus furfuricola]